MIVGLVVTLNSVFGMVPRIIFADWIGTLLAFLYPRLSVNKTFKSASGYRVALLIAALDWVGPPPPRCPHSGLFSLVFGLYRPACGEGL